ncbi:peptidoglycan binding domain-containing protein [Streptomyces bohaiensis]|uniref:peptidoglycan binding domain-containing protein n=1 Tax=Streptomyces bohaiensis TaxID=1431344 RepID=UPI003B7765DD
MSREKDSPTPSFGGREPYGDNPTPGASDGPGAAKPGDKKTETTMTTRIRINIPGSRPIPPVVMREPVQKQDEPPTPPRQSRPPEAEQGAEPSAAGRPDPGAAAAKKASSWFEPRKPLAPGATPPGGVPRQDGPADGGARGDTPPGGTPGATPPGGVPRGDTPPGGSGAVPPLPKRDVGAAPPAAPSFPGFGTRGPAGPTSGPASGDMPLPRADRPAGAPQEVGNTTMDLGGPLPRSSNAEAAERWARDSQTTQAMPAAGQVAPAGSPVLTDPFQHAETPPPSPFGGPLSAPLPDREQSAAEPEPPAAAGKPKKKKRSVVKLAIVAAGGVLVLAYGAGLLLNQQEVPTGTTVLGHEIGGSGQNAVATLNSALAGPMESDLTLVVEGEEIPLKPSVAGLSIDTEATVRNASGTDYNPVAVLGSLVGGSQEVAPVWSVDEEKLAAALSDVTADLGGAPVDGSVSLAGGVPEAVYGEPGTGVDVESAAPLVREAFQQRAASGDDVPVALSATTVEPEIGEAEVDRAMAEFAEPAMSGTVTVAAGEGGPSIQFSPENSLHRFITMEAVGGRLVDSYDLETLETLYGGTFVGIEVARGDGSSTPVTPEDVVSALRGALLETAPEDRIGYIDLG